MTMQESLHGLPSVNKSESARAFSVMFRADIQDGSVQLRYLPLCCVLSRGFAFTKAVKVLSQLVKHYEGLSYDREVVRQQQHRAKRDTLRNDPELRLDFTAFQRDFRLRLRRDTTAFTEDFEVFSESGGVDLSHIVSGKLEDEPDSSCHGSVLQGQFEGSIRTGNGTYYVEPVDRYSSEPSEHHSIIYHEDDLVDAPLGSGSGGFCGSDRLMHLRQDVASQMEPVTRSRRTIDQSKTSCLLHLHADHLFFKRYRNIETVVGQVSAYMRAVNDIFDKSEFDGIEVINFRLKSLSVQTEENKTDPLQQTHVGPEKLLSVYSQHDWSQYCLSYLLTNRDFSGVLGLAWVGQTDDWGGICSKPVVEKGQNSSRNTGLITLQNFGRYQPPKYVHMTFAHELGHSLGAPHDKGANCGTPEVTEGKGWFLMYPHAAQEVQENSDKFSPCSVRDINRILRVKKDECFVVSDRPICGNHIVEDGEECDIGHDENDPCCYSAKEPMEIQCRLKPSKQCSPSQGLCCSSSCVYKASGTMCEEESDCQEESFCDGSSPKCPEPPAKPNMTVCSLGTRVCFNGDCALSVCVTHGLEQCDCPSESRREKCFLCCQQPGEPSTCASTNSSVLTQYFQGQSVALVPGAPCSENHGYCDKFNVCRLLDADGPIARLKNSFLHLNEYEDLGEWMKAYWWAILVAILVVSAVMAGTVWAFGETLEKK
ncbi:disintegrin and metalloproteinase domain-containing protein 10 [Chanos chanos]|uniref:ADAM10 endopeptidase n=1 Tax=Chanos chanos TaxID=29144 RepID=A0A6J2W7X8_CHACN|nr:disintegrin and metalloproteinase domain-containing protein 10-like [Chanos chanos]